VITIGVSKPPFLAWRLPHIFTSPPYRESSSPVLFDHPFVFGTSISLSSSSPEDGPNRFAVSILLLSGRKLSTLSAFAIH